LLFEAFAVRQPRPGRRQGKIDSLPRLIEVVRFAEGRGQVLEVVRPGMGAKSRRPVRRRLQTAEHKRCDVLHDAQPAARKHRGLLAAAQGAHEGDETVHRLHHGVGGLILGLSGACRQQTDQDCAMNGEAAQPRPAP
jgi:hypothetical protein